MLIQNPLTHLYESDYHQWLSETINLIKNKQFDQLDYENLCEELATLGRSEKRAVESLLEQILIHLLLYQYWTSEYQYNKNHWQGEIISFRNQLNRYLDSKTLRNYLQEQVPKIYQNALKVATVKSGIKILPQECPYLFNQVLDIDYFPNQ